MSNTSILACRDPREFHWQLGALPPESGSMTLLGWRQLPEPTDSGVPQAVAAVLARALTNVARVTFPSSATKASGSTVWLSRGGDMVREVTSQGLRDHARAVFKGHPDKVQLVSTRQPATVMTVFEDAEYPWWLQGEGLMLSAVDAEPPDVDLETLFSFLDDGWTRQTATMAARGLVGMMRPGVDGDVAGLLSLTDAFGRAFLGTLENEARLASLNWEVVDERTFAERLSTT